MTGTEALIAASVGASLIGGVSAYQSGQSQKAIASAQADNEAMQARQKAVAVQEELNRRLATANAMFGARGLGDSLTPLVIAESSRRAANSDLLAIRANSNNSIWATNASGKQAEIAGWTGLITGIGNAADSYSRLK